jgi:hypothetical protein
VSFSIRTVRWVYFNPFQIYPKSEYYGWPSAFQIAAGIGVVCGASAVIALVCGCVLMIRETQLAVKGLAYDAKSHNPYT